MNLRTIAAGLPFLDALARWWLDESGPDPLSVADGLILLPTRRAAQSLTEAFLRVSSGRPLLLPRIAAVGAVDEAPLALAGALDLPPAVDPTRRLAVLTRLVLQMGGAGGAPTTADGAWRLARDLAALLDEAYRQEVVLGDVLEDAAEAGFAEHWVQTIRFLTVVTQHWPLWLDDNALMDQTDRALKLLAVQAASWDAAPPPYRVVVAGTTGGIKAVAQLMRVVAHLPRGCVVLPALDLAMDDEVWAGLDESHPQGGMARLLTQMGATRADVRPLEPSPASGRGRTAGSDDQSGAPPGGRAIDLAGPFRPADRGPPAARTRRPAGGGRRHRPRAPRGARKSPRPRSPGHAGPGAGAAGGGGVGPLRRHRRRQCRRGARRHPACLVPAPARSRRRRRVGAGRAARGAETSAGGIRSRDAYLSPRRAPA